MLIDKSGFGLRRIQNQSLTCANEAARSAGGIVLNKLHFLKLPGILNFHAATPQSRLRVTAPLTQWSLKAPCNDGLFQQTQSSSFRDCSFYMHTKKTAPPTRCCNFTIHFSAFRRSGFLSDIYIISDLYKTVSVNYLFFCCAGLPLMRRNSDILRLLSFSSEMLRPLPLDTPITFQRSSPPDEKLRVQKKF